MVSYESASNEPNSDTDKDSVTSTQHIYGTRDSEYSAKKNNFDNKLVSSINEEYEIETIQESYDIIRTFREKANYEDFSIAKIRQKG